MTRLFRCFVALATLIGTTAGVQAQPGKYKFDPGERSVIESFRPRVAEGLEKVLVPASKENPLAKEELELTRKIMTEATNDSECANDVVQWLRRRYVVAEFDLMPRYLKTNTGVVSWDLPVALYLFKGRMEGLFEFTKLTGLYANTLDILWNDGKKWKDPNILAYRLYALNLDLHYKNIASLLGDDMVFDEKEIVTAQKLAKDYKGTAYDQVVYESLLTYFFAENSSLNLSLKKEESRGRDVYAYIKQAHDVFPLSSEFELRFLSRTYSTFGPATLNILLQQHLGKSASSSEKPAYIRQLVKLAVNARLGEATKQLLARLPRLDQQEILAGEEKSARIWLNSLGLK